MALIFPNEQLVHLCAAQQAVVSVWKNVHRKPSKLCFHAGPKWWRKSGKHGGISFQGREERLQGAALNLALAV